LERIESAALAGRFAVIVQVPEVSDMPADAVARIVRQISEDDAPMLKSPRRDPQATKILTMTFCVKRSVD